MFDTILTSLTGNTEGSNYVRGCLVGGWLHIICISNDINYILLHLMIHFLFILIKIDFSLVFNFNILKKMLENIFGIFQVLFIALSSFVSILGSKLLVVFEKAFILQLLSIWKLIVLWFEIMRVYLIFNNYFRHNLHLKCIILFLLLIFGILFRILIILNIFINEICFFDHLLGVWLVVIHLKLRNTLILKLINFPINKIWLERFLINWNILGTAGSK